MITSGKSSPRTGQKIARSAKNVAVSPQLGQELQFFGTQNSAKSGINHGGLRLLGCLFCAIVVVTQCFSAGCQNQKTSSNDHGRPESVISTDLPVLTTEQREQAFLTMRTVAGNDPPTQQAIPGPARGRWSDVPAAARAAAASMEMAVLSANRTDIGWVFTLRSVGDRPAELRVQQLPGDEIYLATATVGLFRDKTDLAQKLLDAFEKRMRAFSRKRKFPDTSN